MQAEATIRICSTCTKPLIFTLDAAGNVIQEGVICCDLYYHEGECLYKSFNPDPVEGEKNWNEHFTEDGDCYFSDWELEWEME